MEKGSLKCCLGDQGLRGRGNASTDFCPTIPEIHSKGFSGPEVLLGGGVVRKDHIRC